MSRFSKRRSLSVVALSAMLALSGSQLYAGSQPLSLEQQGDSPAAVQPAQQEQNFSKPLFMADSAGPNVHGFLNVPFKSAYVTPRGLVVENEGLVFQPVIGLVFPTGDVGLFKDTAVVTGIWQSFNTAQDDPVVGCWNEVDYFLTFSGKVGDFSMALTYGAWFFPQSTTGKPDTEHNIDLKITYADKWVEGWSINPYVDIWWAVGGSSTVVLGDQGGTGYLEFGIVPTKTIKVSGDTPLTFSFPTYFSVGPEGYWDESGDFDAGYFGLFSISANLSVPISAIPVKYGNWHFDVGVTYDYLINDALLEAGNILAGNDNRNVLIGSVGIGVNF